MHLLLMPPSRVSDMPTTEEIFRDFFVLWMNHQHEKLFRHDYFSRFVSSVYSKADRIDYASNRGMQCLLSLVKAHPIDHFLNLLRHCRNMSSSHYLLGRTAMIDLCLVIDYAKEALK